MNTVKIKVEGMACGACAARVEEALTALKGVEKARVNLAQGIVEVTYETEKRSHQELEETIAHIGYKVV